MTKLNLFIEELKSEIIRCQDIGDKVRSYTYSQLSDKNEEELKIILDGINLRRG